MGTTAHASSAPAGTETYSFADLYRLAVGEAVLPPAHPAGPAFQVRPASEAASAPSESPYVFSIVPVTPVKGSLLALAGIAAALWVARRRLGYGIPG